jgi:hydrogenase nickel incorporation protein HypB
MANLITIEQKILKKNADIADENRRDLDRHGVLGVGLVSAPGSGKTSLLERTLAALKGEVRVAVIEGDVQTDRDARRIGALDVPAVQIVTNGTCHLEARMVQEALPRIDLAALDVLFIENVGNLVCPSSYDLGEHLRVVLMSVTEGEDKPVKYPAMFRKARALVLNKTDLLPHLDYDLEGAKRLALQVNPDLRIFETSCRTGEGIPEWSRFLLDRFRALRADGPSSA